MCFSTPMALDPGTCGLKINYSEHYRYLGVFEILRFAKYGEYGNVWVAKSQICNDHLIISRNDMNK